ncbi:peptidyl-tRNA hydrolase [Mesomycoplasma conjunctivae]|uniref:Peptidyl-tRNA hydrolase n=1 Tax=Mesomycoplasma conjunctivae (strain ATCC 25834 / NCTC 10147 / HRC/581) TaxID=572263 RepID=C5J6A5_MESCH|nr:aminoacyl-tRNA hydrolase [Mesomycoplasma conjunctivae]CAT04997.1 Peptidyl-tRNA hydrolase [Mesomycoplasma conjunctivae]VEU66342.1 peptidyl-tRNA hydrolase [Mesomycoplasma conjunctivae]
MKLIVGLGNPGKQYEKTKHNVGFWAIDALAEKIGAKFKQHLPKTHYSIAEDYEIILLKPQTFMNLSGEAIVEFRAFCKSKGIKISDMLVIYDDMDLQIGQAIMRAQGGANGQKGMQNIIDLLATKEIKRIKIGIGRSQHAADYVLSPFNLEDQHKIEQVIQKVVEICLFYSTNNFSSTIQVFNVEKNKI